MSFIERFVDTLTNDEIHDLLCHLTKRFVILNWYQKEDIECLIDKNVTEEEWKEILEKQNKDQQSCDLLSKKSNRITKEFLGIFEDYKFEELLLSLSFKDLKLYAGVTNNSYNKEELAKIICEQLEENKNQVIEAKLEKLKKQLE